MPRTDKAVMEPASTVVAFIGGPPAKPSAAKRYTPFAPPQRGVVQPVGGAVDDFRVSRALAACGRGWISRDGHVVTQGSMGGWKALKTFPASAAIMERLDEQKDAARSARSRAWDASLSDYLRRGRTEEEFREDARESDYAEQLESEFRDPNIDFELREAGWYEIELRRDEGVKEVFCKHLIDEGDPLVDHMQTLAEKLRCRLHVRVLPPLPPLQPNESPYFRTAERPPSYIPASRWSEPENSVVAFASAEESIAEDVTEDGPTFGR